MWYWADRVTESSSDLWQYLLRITLQSCFLKSSCSDPTDSLRIWGLKREVFLCNFLTDLDQRGQQTWKHEIEHSWAFNLTISIRFRFSSPARHPINQRTWCGTHRHKQDRFLDQTKPSYLSKHRVHDGQQIYGLCLLHRLHISPLPSCQHLLQLLVHRFAVLRLLLCHLCRFSGPLELLKLMACRLSVNASLSLFLHLLLDVSLHLREQRREILK